MTLPMLNTFYFYNCNLFGLCSMDKQRQLDCHQFHIYKKYIAFSEGLGLCNITPKLIQNHNSREIG